MVCSGLWNDRRFHVRRYIYFGPRLGGVHAIFIYDAGSVRQQPKLALYQGGSVASTSFPHPPGEPAKSSKHGHLGRDTRAGCPCHDRILHFAVLCSHRRQSLANIRALSRSTEAMDYRGRRATIMGLGHFGGGLAAWPWLARQGALVTVNLTRPTRRCAWPLPPLSARRADRHDSISAGIVRGAVSTGR